MAEKTTRDSIMDVWGPRTPYGPRHDVLGAIQELLPGVRDPDHWPVRLDERTTAAPERWVQGACVLCSNGCALDVGVLGNRIVGVRGRGVDRVNRGRLGPKGLHGWEAHNSPDRLTRPLVRRSGQLVPAGWDEAMDLVIARSRQIVREHTAGAIGFYTSGQLMLEEYYTLAVLGKAGLGTPHMDGNTRLCTATAAAALKASFGADGQPGSYTDLDSTAAILLVGTNLASQQTVLWMRILDRRRGPNPPRLVVIDPRSTETAREADVHLAPVVGTNLALLNGLLHLILAAGQIDEDYIHEHTVGFEALQRTVGSYTPERVQTVTGVPADQVRAAAAIIGGAPSLVSACLQGVYQSMQATAAAVQVNNINLVRGMIGRPGCGVFQMNGQPTAQNTRECGADGDLPGFRNWDNPEHVAQLARLWNVEIDRIPHWAPPTHAMQIFRYAEQGSIKMLWVSATNPAVSLPHLDRVRAILAKEDLFLVVQDAFLTETAAYADVVLPAALAYEKTGCFTNVDRTVHICHKAVDPPGEARSDLDIFLDYARRMNFHDKDGAPLIHWNDPEGAFNAWRECSRGRPCDYSGLSYAQLSEGSGIQWPCNEAQPDGVTHLYTDGVFPTQADQCETYGHDLNTGAARTAQEYRASDPAGRAILHASEYEPPHEAPDEQYPFWLTTGRVVYHFHTRTKTGRSRALNAAAPDAFVELSPADAARLGITAGDLVRVESRRGHLEAPARLGGIRDGLVFVPFHYGYWDEPGRRRAANEITLSEWDPVSKQPHFKYAAVRISKVGG
jgi:ferredoxin-nitrate reductase